MYFKLHLLHFSHYSEKLNRALQTMYIYNGIKSKVVAFRRASSHRTFETIIYLYFKGPASLKNKKPISANSSLNHFTFFPFKVLGSNFSR